jgi:GNAT superfamily N-acetyltransferase
VPDYHDAGEIAWLVAWPRKVEAAEALARACTDQLDQWGVRRQYADGSLPAPAATYGIPEAWPHIRRAVEAVGFSDAAGRTETLLAGMLDAVPEPGAPPLEGLTVRREIDNLSVRFTAVLDDAMVGYLNVRDDLTRGGTMSRLARWVELWEHEVVPSHRRQGIGTWLFRHAVSWARLAGRDRMLADWGEDLGSGALDFLHSLGLRDIGRNRRGWRRTVDLARR